MNMEYNYVQNINLRIIKETCRNKCCNMPKYFAFYRDCFLTYFTHRFRATIGKARLIRDGDKV